MFQYQSRWLLDYIYKYYSIIKTLSIILLYQNMEVNNKFTEFLNVPWMGKSVMAFED